MVHTHQHRNLSLQLESRCVTDIFTDEVLSIENRSPQLEPSKRYEYRSFDEALRIPLVKSAFSTACWIYNLLRCKCFFCFCFLWFWKTTVVTSAKLLDSIFWVRLFLILVDSTIFRIITILRQKYPVLGTEIGEITQAVRGTVDRYRMVVVVNAKLFVSKFVAIVRVNVVTLLGFAPLCSALTPFLHRFESLVDWYFPVETVYPAEEGTADDSHHSEECNGGGCDGTRKRASPVDFGLENVD